MGIRKQGIQLLSFIILIVNFIFLNNGFVYGRRIATKSTQLAKPRGTIKTIVCDDANVIDCVDVYNQPAFDHPLLKNHTIEKTSSAILNGSSGESIFQSELIQDWHRYGECPEGSIPIKRTQHTFHGSLKYIPHNGDSPHSRQVGETKQEYATVLKSGGKYYGAQAKINVWQPETENGEFSLAQIWVTAGPDETKNTVEAGWITNSVTHQETSLFIYWTSNGYQKSGCYNLACPGFVQTNKKFAIGVPFSAISSYNGHQYNVYINIYQDKESKDWWLQVNNEVIGYWPGRLFNILVNGADKVVWGGEVLNINPDGHHTSTQMGSGHFPYEGFAKAAFFTNVAYHTEQGVTKDAEGLTFIKTNSACYDLALTERDKVFGTYFYFGGPGRSDIC